MLNAASFEAQGFSVVITEENLDEDILADKIQELYFTRLGYIDNMEKSSQLDAIETIVSLIKEEISDCRDLLLWFSIGIKILKVLLTEAVLLLCWFLVPITYVADPVHNEELSADDSEKWSVLQPLQLF